MTQTEDSSVDPWIDGGVTVGQLREALSLHHDDCTVIFGPDTQRNALRFYRVKKRGEELVQIEFNP
ncbi:MAG: hypothetical protein DI528_13015 [Shinella sp.]|nr:MAG: hypothetical protein DI528_13015 [Shinella sp.]